MASDSTESSPQAEEIVTLRRALREAEANLEATRGQLVHCIAQYDSMFERAVDAMFVYDAEGRHTRVNQRALLLTGYSEPELLAIRHEALYVPVDKALLPDLPRYVEESGERRALRPLRRKDGDERYVVVGLVHIAGGFTLATLHDSSDRVQALLDVERMRANLEEAQARTHLGSWDLDLGTGRGLWSREMFTLVGREPSEGIPSLDEFLEYIHPDDRERVKQNTANAGNLAAESPSASHPVSFTFRTNAAPGNERILLANFYKAARPPGVAPKLVGTTLDITDRVRAEAELVEREESLRATFLSIGDAVIATDPLGRITRMNPVAEALTGWKIDEARGRPLLDVFQIFHAQTGERAEAPVERVLATGQIVGLANDTLLRSRDGKEYQIADSGAPIKDGSGAIIGVVLVFRDVTDEYLMQKRLKQHVRERSEAHNFLLNVLDTIPVRVYWKDVNLRYLGGNALFAADAGLAHPGLLTGQTDRDLPWREQCEVLEHQDRLVIDDAEALLSVEEERTTVATERRIVRTSRVPLRNLEGDVVGVIGTYKDITLNKQVEADKLRLEAQLRQAQKLETIGTLAGGIAHDFNNILTPILGYADLALSTLDEASPVRRDLTEIYIGARRARELVQQILTFSRQVDREITRVALPDIIREAIGLLRPLIPSSIEIQTQLQPDCKPILADATQIHQIIVNLCTNAYQAMKEGGVLRIELSEQMVTRPRQTESLTLRPGAHLRIAVSDTGTGMTPDVLGRVFEPFFSTKPVDEGTGLGLSVAYGIARSLGGDIIVESEPDRGTTFIVYLPAGSDDAPPANRITPTNEKLLLGGSESILVVDDEEAVLDVLARMLARLGYEVHTEQDPVRALEHARDRVPDLILTDLTMPIMSGLQLATHIKTIHPELPIILMTGYGPAIDQILASRLGIGHILHKPVGLTDLATAVRSALAVTRPPES